MIRDPDRYGPRGQGHISVQHLQPIDIAPATNGHEADRVSKDGREKTTFRRESTGLAHSCLDPIITRNTHEKARQTHQPLRKQVRKVNDTRERGKLTSPDDSEPNRPPQQTNAPYLLGLACS